jgi:soluble lytic murein transglycosylase-like protein
MCIRDRANNLDACFNVASARYQIPVKLLKAIAKTENRKLDELAVGVNTNHSFDIGIMQINSSWFPMLNKVGIAKADLFDGCKNIQIGSWILAQNIKRYGFNRQAIGAYHSPTIAYQEAYANKVLGNM